MADLHLTMISPLLIAKMDHYLKQTHEYPNRSALVSDVMDRFLLYQDEAFLKFMPDTIRILSEDAVQKEAKWRGDALNLMLETVHKCVDLLNSIWAVLRNETVPNEDENEEL
ncbi:hypothetical protein [Ethanoligenens sp.]|uniref:hypothetical protein n=1 Tax=Ethanoligenens sp. TaxID=2099655 RepID=UPI0039ED9713